MIVDDGSSNEFLSHLRQVKNWDPRIRVVFQKQNTGIHNTRNVILEHTKGSLLTFVDADDYIPLDYLEKLYEAFIYNGAEDSFSFCSSVKFSGTIPEVPTSTSIEKIDNDTLAKGLKGQFGHSLWCRLIPTSLIQDYKFDPALGFEDAQIIPFLCSKAKVISRTNSTFYFYRQRPGSIMHSNNSALLQALKTYEHYLKFAEKHCAECIPFLRIMVTLSELKLCCVDYNDQFTKDSTRAKSKELKALIKEYGYITPKQTNKQIFTAIHFVWLFRFLYRKKRNTVIKK